MLHSVTSRIGSTFFVVLALATTAYACDSSEVTPGDDAGPGIDASIAETTPPANVDSSVPADAKAGEDSSVPRPPPVFLPTTDYADAVKIDPSFPYGVVARIGVDGDVLGAHWGNHGGPMVSTSVYANQEAGSKPGVVRYTIPATATGTATKKELAFATASDLPRPFFYGPDGMVDLPFGNLAILTYTGSGAGFPGEGLVYSKDYDAVVSRAKSSGIYSAAGVGTKSFVYSALSPFAATLPSTTDNGLYAAELCGTNKLAPEGACKPGAKLFGWAGNSGPVAVDTQGNAFVGASLDNGDAIYAASAAEIQAVGAATRVELANKATGGTASIAAIGPEGAAPGFVVAKGYDGATPTAAYAQGYKAPLAKDGALIDAAIAGGTATEAFSLFSSAQNDLWVAVELSAGTPRKVFLQLRRKP